MADTILVLTEQALQPSDADQIVELYSGQDVRFRVLVPADTERNVARDFLDYLALGDVREAWDAAVGKEKEPSPKEATQTAEEELATSIQELTERGGNAEGDVVADDPMPAVVDGVVAGKARELIVVTRPHLLEDTFHQDWASKARNELGVPVLHLYGGTDRIVG